MTNILSINWEITRKCNLRCAYCRVWGGVAKENELSTSAVFKVIDQLKKNGYRHLKFTGGEPLIRPDFWDIVKYARQNGLLVSLISNGLLIDDKIAEKMEKYCSIVGISLDSVDEQLNNRLGRLHTAKVLAAIKNLTDRGVNVVILSTITKLNRNSIPALLDCAYNLHVKELKVNDMVNNGRALDNIERLGLKRPLLADITDLTDQVAKTTGRLPKLTKHFKCECSQDNLYLDYQGDLYPCVEMYYSPGKDDFCLGNLTRDSLSGLLSLNQKFIKQIQNSDYCAYSYLSTPGFSACLNRAACPKSLTVYMKNAKS